MKLTFDATPKALAAADHLLVLAPKTAFGPRARAAGALQKWLGTPLADLAHDLGAEASVGLLGGAATSRTPAGKRLTVGALPTRFRATTRRRAPSRCGGSSPAAASAASSRAPCS